MDPKKINKRIKKRQRNWIEIWKKRVPLTRSQRAYANLEDAWSKEIRKFAKSTGSDREKMFRAAAAGSLVLDRLKQDADISSKFQELIDVVRGFFTTLLDSSVPAGEFVDAENGTYGINDQWHPFVFRRGDKILNGFTESILRTKKCFSKSPNQCDDCFERRRQNQLLSQAVSIFSSFPALSSIVKEEDWGEGVYERVFNLVANYDRPHVFSVPFDVCLCTMAKLEREQNEVLLRFVMENAFRHVKTNGNVRMEFDSEKCGACGATSKKVAQYLTWLKYQWIEDWEKQFLELTSLKREYRIRAVELLDALCRSFAQRGLPAIPGMPVIRDYAQRCEEKIDESNVNAVFESIQRVFEASPNLERVAGGPIEPVQMQGGQSKQQSGDPVARENLVDKKDA